MLMKRLFNLKNIILPFMLIFGLTGLAGQSFAAKSRDHDKASSKVVKKKPAHAKKAKASKKTKKTKSKKDTHKSKKTKKASKDKQKSKKTKTHSKKPASSKKHTSKSMKAKENYYQEDKAVGTRDDGRTIFEGPRGGRYYINDSGNKVYIQR